MTITRLKYDGRKVSIDYQQQARTGADPDEISLVCADPPRLELVAALQALAADVVAIGELRPSDRDLLTVRGVTCTWKDDVLGAVITALKALETANAPLVLNTPHLPEKPYSGNPGDPNPVLPPGAATRVRTLLTEAERYLAGDRAQGRLFTPPDAGVPADDTTQAGRCPDGPHTPVPVGSTPAPATTR